MATVNRDSAIASSTGDHTLSDPHKGKDSTTAVVGLGEQPPSVTISLPKPSGESTLPSGGRNLRQRKLRRKTSGYLIGRRSRDTQANRSRPVSRSSTSSQTSVERPATRNGHDSDGSASREGRTDHRKQSTDSLHSQTNNGRPASHHSHDGTKPSSRWPLGSSGSRFIRQPVSLIISLLTCCSPKSRSHEDADHAKKSVSSQGSSPEMVQSNGTATTATTTAAVAAVNGEENSTSSNRGPIPESITSDQKTAQADSATPISHHVEREAISGHLSDEDTASESNSSGMPELDSSSSVDSTKTNGLEKASDKDQVYKNKPETPSLSQDAPKEVEEPVSETPELTTDGRSLNKKNSSHKVVQLSHRESRESLQQVLSSKNGIEVGALPLPIPARHSLLPSANDEDNMDLDEDDSELRSEITSPPGNIVSESSERLVTHVSRQHLLDPIAREDIGKKCLVLDLDETLVHSSFRPVDNPDYVVPVILEGQEHDVYVIKRPGVDEFLIEVGKHFEVVVFTASLSMYADPVLDLLDPTNVVKHRLFRDSCNLHNGNYVKDLSRLGRNVNHSIIIDNSPASYAFHPQNAIAITSWFNDPHDTELLDLIPLLIDITAVDDVSAVLNLKHDHSAHIDTIGAAFINTESQFLKPVKAR
ncbi:hypothetical protein H4219_001103 [Mycoemilia scoparia]|uniref:protein-serine/threonine phosphatase n=1 Tax=Mycoemilia scoparia TaxID=417184 RepID=A0A9W8A5E7_9FUNG|nr:hypothetical protein H4219_001103 [Mycoemilia scoparia]